MKKETSRREFLVTGILAGLVVGCKSNPFVPEDSNMEPSGEKVKLLSVDGEEIEVDKAFLKPVPDLPAVSNSVARVGIANKSFVMVIDLSRCKNL
jgi:molybdopterin-containing oxidoreductase family iron-sulfur binding subunit